MPRFTLKSILVVLAVAALWLSTVADYLGKNDVRCTIVMLTVVVSGVKTYRSSGRWKCFWLAFFIVLLATAIRQRTIAPDMGWVAVLLQPYFFEPPFQRWAPQAVPTFDFVLATLTFALDIVLATLAGIVGLYIYKHSPTEKGH